MGGITVVCPMVTLGVLVHPSRGAALHSNVLK